MKAAKNMDPHEKKLLRILNALHPVSKASQRDLAASLSISLGSINAKLKWMLECELIRTKGGNGNRIYYHLTSYGSSERRRLSLLDWERSLDGYAEMQAKIQSVLSAPSMTNVRRIAFLGTGQLAEIAYLALLKADMQLTAIVDDHDAGGYFLDYCIVPTTDLPTTPCDRILLTGLDYYLKRRSFDNVATEFKEKLVRLDT